MRSVSMALAAAGDAWLPKSDLFQLNFRMASIMLLVAAGGIALGLLGTALFRYRRKRLNLHTGEVRRHSVGHMLAHWLNAVGFLLALFTGAIMLKWLPVPIGRTPLFVLHYIGAACVLIGLVATVVNAATKGTTSVHRLIPSRLQIRMAFLEVLGYAGLLGDRGILGFRALQWPAAWRRDLEKAVGFTGFGRDGKYLAAEEVLSYPLWALLALSIVSTGILKAARYAYPLPGSVVKWLTIVHDWTTVGIVFMLLAHVGALVLVRTNWPLFSSMFTGKVGAAYVKENHGEWYEELVDEVEREKPPAENSKGAAT